jgi:hypothetical protein
VKRDELQKHQRRFGAMTQDLGELPNGYGSSV